MKSENKTKAIVLFSGGLDSILVAKMLHKQNINLVLLHIDNGFEQNKRTSELKNFADSINAQFIIENVIADFCENILPNPKYGYGKAMNPCIDCHAYMLRIAHKIAKQEDADFIATGEVINQRPMSQTKSALFKVDNLAKSKIPVIRPLSAKLLDETLIESNGIIDRKKLEGIDGRNRTRQIEMAKSLGLTSYPNPAGGCLLTEVGFSNKLKAIQDTTGYINSDDIIAAKNGRVFVIGDIIFITGRNKEDNKALKEMKTLKYRIVDPPVEAGPVCAVSGEFDYDTAIKLASIMLRYCNIEQSITHQIKFTLFNFKAKAMPDKKVQEYIIK